MLLIIAVRLSVKASVGLAPGLLWSIGTILLVALVPGVLTRIARTFISIKQYRLAEEVLRIAISFRRVESLLPLKYFGFLLIANQDALFLLLRDQQRYAEALKISDQTIQFAQKRFGAESAVLCERLINRCALLSQMGDLAGAEEVAQRALNIMDKQSGTMDQRQTENLCLLLNNAGLVFANAGKPEKANELLKRSFDLKEATFGKDSPQMQIAYANQGYAYLKADNYLAAEEFLKRAIKLGEAQKDNSVVSGNNWNNLGDALRGKGELDQAELALKEALRIRQLTLPPNHPYMAYSYNNFGKLYRDQGKFEEAKQYFEKALQIREAISPKHPDVAITLQDYASLLQKMGRITEAEKLEARANAITSKNSQPSATEEKTKKRDWATTVLVRTVVLISLVILIPLGSIMFIDLRAPEKVPEGLDAERYYGLGVIYIGAGWIELSREALNRAIKLDPKGPTGAKANIFLKTSIPRYHVEKQATELNIQGFNEHASGQDAKAISTYEECIKLYPNFEWPYSNLGSLYLDKGNTAKAEELLKKAISINPSYVNALVNLAKAKRKENDPAGAQQYIDKALACANGDTLMTELVKNLEKK